MTNICYIFGLFNHRSDPCHNYKTVHTGEAFLQVRPSLVVGLGGANTGNGLFTLKEIPATTWVTSYAPLAPVRIGREHQQSDYILKTTKNGREVEIDGSLCPFGLGKIVQDGSFPFCLADNFSRLVTTRVNCEITDRDGEVWLRSIRAILPSEELLTRYSHDNSYWKVQFSAQELQTIQSALLNCSGNNLLEAEEIIRNLR